VDRFGRRIGHPVLWSSGPLVVWALFVWALVV
jgi:hypothetical protein